MNSNNGLVQSVLNLPRKDFEAIVQVYNLNNAASSPAPSSASKAPAKAVSVGAKGTGKRGPAPHGLQNEVREYLRAHNGVVMSKVVEDLTAKGLDTKKVKTAIYLMKTAKKVTFTGKGMAAIIDSTGL
jgi:hypothetical protein